MIYSQYIFTIYSLYISRAFLIFIMFLYLQSSFTEVARLFTEFFRDLDVVPSDVVAGLMLLRRQQKTQRKYIMNQVFYAVVNMLKTRNSRALIKGAPYINLSLFGMLNFCCDWPTPISFYIDDFRMKKPCFCIILLIKIYNKRLRVTYFR